MFYIISQIWQDVLRYITDLAGCATLYHRPSRMCYVISQTWQDVLHYITDLAGCATLYHRPSSMCYVISQTWQDVLHYSTDLAGCSTLYHRTGRLFYVISQTWQDVLRYITELAGCSTLYHRPVQQKTSCIKPHVNDFNLTHFTCCSHFQRHYPLQWLVASDSHVTIKITNGCVNSWVASCLCYLLLAHVDCIHSLLH